MRKVFVSETFQQFTCAWPLLGVLTQANFDVFDHVRACVFALEVLWQFVGESQLLQYVHPLHGSLEGVEQFEYDDSERVDVHLLVVFLTFELFRGAIEARSDSFCFIAQEIVVVLLYGNTDGSLLRGGQAEISDFDFVLISQEYVGGFEIAVYDVFGVDIGQSFEYASEQLYLLFLVVEVVVDELAQIDARAQLHRDVQYFEREALQSVDDRRLGVVPGVQACVADAGTSRNLHFLHLLFFEDDAVVLLLLEDDAAVFDEFPLIAVAVTAASGEPDAGAVVLPVLIDVVEFGYFGLLVLGEGHVLDEFLYGVGVFEPGLVVPHDVGVVEFGEQRYFLQHFTVVEIFVVDHCFLYGVDVAVKLVPYLVDFAESALSDQLQLFKLGLIPASGVVLFDAGGFFVLLDLHGGRIWFFDHVVQVEYLIEYFSVDFLFEFDVLGVDVFLVEVELCTVLGLVVGVVGLSAGTVDVGVFQFGLLLGVVDGEHEVLIDGSGDVEDVGVVWLPFESVLVEQQDRLQHLQLEGIQSLLVDFYVDQVIRVEAVVLPLQAQGFVGAFQQQCVVAVVAVVRNNFFEVQQEVIPQKVHFLADFKFPLPVTLALTYLLDTGSLLNFAYISLGFLIDRLTPLIVFFSALIELMVAVLVLLLLQCFFSMQYFEGLLLFLTVRGGLFLCLLFVWVAEHFDCFVFAMLLLCLFWFLLSVMILLSFCPAVAGCLMNVQTNTTFVVCCLFGYYPNDPSHQHVGEHQNDHRRPNKRNQFIIMNLLDKYFDGLVLFDYFYHHRSTNQYFCKQSYIFIMIRNSQSSQKEQTYPSLNTDSSAPLGSKIEEVRIRNLEDIISMLCQLINDFARIFERQEVMLTDRQLNGKIIIQIKQANNELRYHQKISPLPTRSNKALSSDIDQTVQQLANLRMKEAEVMLPRVRRLEENMNSALASQLSTITEKQSEQNLLHNYLRKNMTNKRRSKTNMGKNVFLSGISSIEDLQFEVIREETRKSLDNPYHKNNETRKGLYNELEKMKVQDNLLPSVKTYLDKHRKNVAHMGAKLPQYQIHKLI